MVRARSSNSRESVGVAAVWPAEEDLVPISSHAAARMACARAFPYLSPALSRVSAAFSAQDALRVHSDSS